MPQFDVSSFSSQLFWLVIVFGFLYFVISKYIAPKAESILSKRESLSEENLDNAERYNKKAKEIGLLQESKLVEVNSYIENLYREANEQLDRELTRQKNELILILDKKREKALTEVQNYIAGFHMNETASCIKLAAFIIHRVTDKNVDMELLKEIHGKLK